MVVGCVYFFFIIISLFNWLSYQSHFFASPLLAGLARDELPKGVCLSCTSNAGDSQPKPWREASHTSSSGSVQSSSVGRQYERDILITGVISQLVVLSHLEYSSALDHINYMRLLVLPQPWLQFLYVLPHLAKITSTITIWSSIVFSTISSDSLLSCTVGFAILKVSGLHIMRRSKIVEDVMFRIR